MRGGLALGTMGLMVLISCMNGLSVAGMAIGATVALPQLLARGYDKRMVTGVIQGGSSLGILLPPSVVLVLYAMIARQPVLQLWLAGILPGLLMAALFTAYIYIRCRLNPALGPALPREELDGFYAPAGAVEDYLSVRPGVTGPWQVGGRSDSGYTARVALDAAYARNPSLRADLAILARTAGIVLTRRGAY